METEVYSWCLPLPLKSDLEEAARARKESLAELLEQITRDWLQQGHGLDDDEEEHQQRLREAAFQTIGTLDSGRADRDRPL